jgi:hypothetical protein
MDVKRPFWAWVFCENDGTPSFSRVGTAVILAFACGWISAVVRWTHSLPEFAGVSLFVTILYGANKLSSVLKRD